MNKDGRILNRFAEKAYSSGETLPVLPVIEIAGDQRVLIEGHFGVVQYTGEKIGIKVKFGQVFVCGCGLRLVHMTKERLVICGRIDTVTLLRRDRK